MKKKTSFWLTKIAKVLWARSNDLTNQSKIAMQNGNFENANFLQKSSNLFFSQAKKKFSEAEVQEQKEKKLN